MLSDLNLRFSEMRRTGSLKISFHWANTSANLKNREALKRFIKNQLRLYGHRSGALAFIFCTDPFLLKINQNFLKHQDFTDVLTFDMSSKDTLEAEIYISIDRVRENAGDFGVSINEELHRVIFHGVLHLCGYKDKKASDRKKMRSQETKLIDNYLNT